MVEEHKLFKHKLIFIASRVLLDVVVSISLPYMLCQVSLQAAVLGPIMNCSVYLEHPSKLINWTMIIIDQGCRVCLIIVIIISFPIRIPLILYYHIMQDNTSIHNLRKCFPFPHTCWVSYYSKTSL